MKNWTDKLINWNQLPGTEVKRLIDTWGMAPDQIAKYDKKHGFVSAAPAKVSKSTPAKSKPTKVEEVPKAKRQRHSGANGEIKFVEHRNLYVGFWDSRVVVTKRTREACLEVLQKDYNFSSST
jgi:hypothetical protein